MDENNPVTAELLKKVFELIKQLDEWKVVVNDTFQRHWKLLDSFGDDLGLLQKRLDEFGERVDDFSTGFHKIENAAEKLLEVHSKPRKKKRWWFI
jgi:hypothetical protein